MNILGLVFSLMLILSYSFFATWEKQNGSSRLRTTYVGHQKAHRKILRSYESELYANLRHQPLESTTPSPKKEKEEANEEPASSAPKLNGECSHLNLWPLLEEGREEHKALYETAAKLFRTFYAPLFDKKARVEYQFLDHFLKCAKASLQKESLFAIEKLSLNDPELQLIYYKMLKGRRGEMPSLLDYIKFDPEEDKICLFHAHPNLIGVLFGPKAAAKLYDEIHKENPPPITKELIEQICSEAHLISIDPELIALLDLGRPNHKKEGKMTFIAEDAKTHVSLRKTFQINKS